MKKIYFYKKSRSFIFFEVKKSKTLHFARFARKNISAPPYSIYYKKKFSKLVNCTYNNKVDCFQRPEKKTFNYSSCPYIARYIIYNILA